MWRVGLALAVAATLAVTAGGLLNFQRSAQTGLEDRFANRVSASARFVSTYVDQLAQTERRVAENHLAAAFIGADDFEKINELAGFDAAVLLNNRGELLNVFPARPDLIGKNLAATYPHLAAAVSGEVGISNVTLSAAKGVPIVAIAVPFDTPQGRRVYSGAYAVASTPLAALISSTPVKSDEIFLIDAAGNVAAKTGLAPVSLLALSDVQPQLADLTRTTWRGTYASGEVPHFFASSVVAGTPWRVVAAAPSSAVFAPVERHRWVPWAVFGGFALTLILAALLLLRNVQASARLAGVNTRLEEIARTDVLTSTFTRRHLSGHLSEAISRAQRWSTPLAVLMLDVDHFKVINDTYGHGVGDEVLTELATRLRSVLREVDALGRWGGEEFLVVAEHTTEEGAFHLGERLRSAVAESPVRVGGHELVVTVSVGLACSSRQADLEALVDDADQAMYEAKRAGRDTVILAGATTVP